MWYYSVTEINLWTIYKRYYKLAVAIADICVNIDQL